MKNQVLLLGNYRQTVTVARSLHRAGFQVIVASPGGKKEFVELSRAVSGVWKCEEYENPNFLNELDSYLKNSSSDSTYLFPIGENCLKTLADNADRFSRKATIIRPAPELVARCLDKRKTFELAMEHDVPLPKTRPFSSIDDWMEHARLFGFPIIIKQNNSFSLVMGKKAYTCSDEHELSSFFEKSKKLQELNFENLILQKKVEGFRHNCHFAAREGKIIAFFEQKVLRTDVFDGSGYCVEGISVLARKDLSEYCARLISAMGYTGVGCVQFLVEKSTEKRTDKAYLLEINPRLDATCALPFYCGVDFPLLAVQCAKLSLGLGSFDKLASYPLGKRICWISGDVIGLVRAFRGGNILISQGLGWFFKIIKSALSSHTHVIWSWTDPLPAVRFVSDYCSLLFCRIFRLKP